MSDCPRGSRPPDGCQGGPQRPPGWGATPFCTHDGLPGAWCQSSSFRTPELAPKVWEWRASWQQLSQAARRNAVLDHLRTTGRTAHASEVSVVSGVPEKSTMDRWFFLGRPLCSRAYRRITGTHPWRAVKDWRAGMQVYVRPGCDRPSHVKDQMHGAIWAVVRHFADSSPLAGAAPDDVIMPFSQKVQLFRLIQLWHTKRLLTAAVASAAVASPGSPAPPSRLFSRPPSYETFRKVLRRPEFAKVKFHRVVPMGRCPKCCLLRWRCMSAPPAERPKWQALAAAHHWLQLAQKRQYAADRAVAAASWPPPPGSTASPESMELYMALDGGSGAEFVLPHMAAHDVELPSKAMGSAHTVPMKVMNCLAHGDTRSHVILCPGTILAGASLTCESIAVVMNTAFHDHGDLPMTATVQMDNASCNHNMLVVAFMAQHVRRPGCSASQLVASAPALRMLQGTGCTRELRTAGSPRGPRGSPHQVRAGEPRP